MPRLAGDHERLQVKIAPRQLDGIDGAGEDALMRATTLELEGLIKQNAGSEPIDIDFEEELQPQEAPDEPPDFMKLGTDG